MTSRQRAIATAALLSGCGEPLQDASYLGEPLLTLSGEILLTKALDEDAERLRVAIFWMFQADERLEVSEQLVVGTAFPALFSLSLFLPPPPEVMVPVPESVAIGLPLLYLDTDADRTWDVGTEAVVGGSSGTSILYSDEGFFTLTGEALIDAGYAAVRFDACQEPGRAPPLEEVSPEGNNLTLGPDFLASLVDIDCDGDLSEWDGLCLGGCPDE